MVSLRSKVARHAGHVRFFEEASALGDLAVVVGNGVNVGALKGAGHPMIDEDERRYVVGGIQYVKQAPISSGMGWLDADPEIKRLKPDYDIVNEDGDKGGMRKYCAGQGIDYVVLKRVPAPGLPQRSSTNRRQIAAASEACKVTRNRVDSTLAGLASRKGAPVGGAHGR